MRIVLLILILLSLFSISWIEAQNAQEKAELVHRRILFGSAGQKPVQLSSNKGWLELARLYSPFGAAAPAPAENTIRKWRLYAIYWDPFVGVNTNIEIKFVFPDAQFHPQLKLPQLASQEEGLRADGYSDWFQFGSGHANEIHLSNGTCYAQFQSNTPGITTAHIYWVELLAYDVTLVPYEEPYEMAVEPIQPIPPVEEPPLETVEMPQTVTLIGKVIHKPWSKSMESWLAGGSEYCILEVAPSPAQVLPFEGTIYLRPSDTVNLMQIAKHSGGMVQVTGIIDIPAPKPLTEEDRFSPRPADMMGPDGRVVRAPQAGSGKGIIVQFIDFYSPNALVPTVITYTLRGKLVLELPKMRKGPFKQSKYYLDFTGAYINEPPPLEGPIYLLPSAEVPIHVLAENASRLVEVTGTLDPKDSKRLIVSSLQNIVIPTKIYTLRGKIQYKRWTKSMESYLAGGSDYCILETTGFYNEHNPIVGTIYLRPSDQISFNEIRKYAGKMVEIVGEYDVPERQFLSAENNLEQRPIEYDINGNEIPVTETKAPGSGHGIRVYEIRIVK